MKTNCFSYTDNGCVALNEDYCKNGDCAFFKTKEKAKQDLEKANKRLASLPREEQEGIADKYYGGKISW